MKKRIKFHVDILKYTWRELGDKELAYLIEKYKWIPLKNFSTNRILIEFDVKDIIVFPKQLRNEIL